MKPAWAIRIRIIGLIVGSLCGLADANSDTITIDSYVKPSVEVAISQEECVWELSPIEPGIYTKDSRLEIRSNAPWIITVKEENATGGHMTEWNGNSYGNGKLSIPMMVKADQSVTLPNTDEIPIKSGLRTGSTPQEVDFSFVQQVTEKDAIEGGNRYRMVVTFTGSPAA
ncbi:MAG: hypothetical protein NTY37_13430 [Methanothrix sp.]|nr:hypothetical protein [Methanothrix sp.]